MPSDSNLNEVVRFERVSKVYGPQRDVALYEVSFAVVPGEFLCLIGPSGGGKSTILKIIAGLEQVTSGQVLRPSSVAMVFQSGALLPWLNVYENVALGLRAQGLAEEKVRRAALAFIGRLGLRDFMAKYPRELSGGQRQRVGIARALAVDPEVLLLDEPFSALDPKITEELHKDILGIWKETGKTVIMVSHLIEEAVILSQRIILVKNFTVAKVFPVELMRPRREQEADFAKLVREIRREFFS